MKTADMLEGVGFALAAGLVWGMVFVVPVLLPEYNAATLAFGRYMAFGVVALGMAALDWARLRSLSRSDWHQALALSLVGNIVYYLFLAASIQAAGVPLASILIGTLPVVIAVCANGQQRSLPWARLVPSLLLMGIGIGCVNASEWQALADGAGTSYLWGAALAVGAVAAWTWYPIHNAAWLKAHPQRSASTWTTAQGVATLPLSLLGWVLLGLWQGASDPAQGWVVGLGPRPLLFVGLMLALGLLASWAGTWAWSRASALLPTALSGQLIVFETLAALAYGYAYRGQWPEPVALTGIALLVAGVVAGVRAFQPRGGH